MTYQYNSIIYGGPVQATYNAHGILILFEVLNKNETEKVNTNLAELKLHYNEADFKTRAQQFNIKLTEVDRVVSFEMFWEKYKQKDCGRTKGEAAWKQLSKADQLAAYDFIDAFKGILKNNNTPTPYATTYLNQKRWIR